MVIFISLGNMENRIIIEEVESALQLYIIIIININYNKNTFVISRLRQCIPTNRHYFEYLQWKEHYFRILLPFQCSRLFRSYQDVVNLRIYIQFFKWNVINFFILYKSVYQVFIVIHSVCILEYILRTCLF